MFTTTVVGIYGCRSALRFSYRFWPICDMGSASQVAKKKLVVALGSRPPAIEVLKHIWASVVPIFSNLHGFITKRIAPESNGLQHHFTHSHLQFTISRTEAFTRYLTWTILILYTFTNEQNFLRKLCCYPHHFPSNCGSVWKWEEKPWNTCFHPLGNHPFPCQDSNNLLLIYA